MPGRLTSQETTFFKDNGYLIYDQPVFSDAKFEALQAHFETKLNTWAEDSGGQSPEHMDVPHFTDPKLYDWLLDDEILDIVESVIGPDIALWSSHFICKPPGTGKRVPWHEDSAYWGQLLDPMEVVTVWLAIDPSSTDNGCMRVIPGTHVDGYSEYVKVDNPNEQVFDREVASETFDETTAVDLVLEPNQCSLHHAKTIHGSNPNTSSMRRCGYTMRYVPSTSTYDPGAHMVSNAHQIYLARGEDHAGNTYGDPTSVNEAWVNARPEERAKIKKYL